LNLLKRNKNGRWAPAELAACYLTLPGGRAKASYDREMVAEAQLKRIKQHGQGKNPGGIETCWDTGHEKGVRFLVTP
jgi:hypothetical protein